MMLLWEFLFWWQCPRWSFLSYAGAFQIAMLASTLLGRYVGITHPGTLAVSILCTVFVVGLDWANFHGDES